MIFFVFGFVRVTYCINACYEGLPSKAYIIGKYRILPSSDVAINPCDKSVCVCMCAVCLFVFVC